MNGQVLDEALNEVEALQKPSSAEQTGNTLNFVALSRRLTNLPSDVRLSERVS